MRNATWATTAILMFGCAQGVPGGDPRGDLAAATPPAADGGPTVGVAPDAGVGPCDPQIAAAKDVRISDTGACPGVMPAAVKCAADLIICSGVSQFADGAPGSVPGAGTSDGRGSVVLSCLRSEVGPPEINSLFVPKPSGFVSKARLGTDVRPLADGFISSQGSYLMPPPEYDFLAHDGSLRNAATGGHLYAGPNGGVILKVAKGELVADSFAADGAAVGTATVGTFTAPPGSLMLGGAMSASGATLVIWQVYGESNATARWLARDGSPATAAFSIAGWTDTAPIVAALSGGGIAVAAQPESGVSSRRWRGVIAPGATVETAPPVWLSSRGSFFLLPGGKAMAFGASGTEILTADGTVCGTLDLSGPLLGIGVDGTAFARPDERTFRIYPQLFR